MVFLKTASVMVSGELTEMVRPLSVAVSVDISSLVVISVVLSSLVMIAVVISPSKWAFMLLLVAAAVVFSFLISEIASSVEFRLVSVEFSVVLADTESVFFSGV